MSRRRMVRRRLPLTHTPDSRYNHLIGSPIQSVVDRLHEFATSTGTCACGGPKPRSSAWVAVKYCCQRRVRCTARGPHEGIHTGPYIYRLRFVPRVDDKSLTYSQVHANRCAISESSHSQ